MSSKPETFDDVQSRPSDQLRELLGASPPQLRVWAAWALGLRLGSGVVPLLTERIPDEPHGGVRRHFVRILAGFEAFEKLRDLEASDPDPLVRRDAREFRRRCSDGDSRSTEGAS